MAPSISNEMVDRSFRWWDSKAGLSFQLAANMPTSQSKNVASAWVSNRVIPVFSYCQKSGRYAVRANRCFRVNPSRAIFGL